ncbi:hypothetical protein FWD20_00950 [Candidatus Saccharibacteria bacterium]|nr:hypothetical protein [Candidatus Saccharibacteria bacterium]
MINPEKMASALAGTIPAALVFPFARTELASPLSGYAYLPYDRKATYPTTNYFDAFGSPHPTWLVRPSSTSITSSNVKAIEAPVVWIMLNTHYNLHSFCGS